MLYACAGMSWHGRRKLRHVEVCLDYPVAFETRTTGFEVLDLPYLALPESDLVAVDLGTTFLGKELAAPILIGAMTGGAELSGVINRNLAQAAQRLGVGLMLGSQRVMLEEAAARASFEVRAVAPEVLLVGNLGVAQLNRGYGAAELERAVTAISADALALHTNPLQEALQRGGDTDFSGLIAALERLVPALPFPVILKEVGHGLGGEVAQRVRDVGFSALDVAGAGGTSWARVEEFVNYGEIRHRELAEWGIPTAEALRQVRTELPTMPLIASGGIRSGVDVAKAIALGAQACALAFPLLRAATESADAVVAVLEQVLFELRVAMHGCGVRSVAELANLELAVRD